MNRTQTRRLSLCTLGLLLLAVPVLTLWPSPSAPAPSLPSRPAPVALEPAPQVARPMARTSLERPRGAYWAPAGSRFRFDFAGNSEVVMQREQIQSEVLGFDLEGDMEVVILGRRPGEMMFQLRFPGLRLRPRGSQDPASVAPLASDLERGVTVLAKEDGATSGLRFPQALPSSSRDWLRSLVAAFRFVVPVQAVEGELTSWESEEDNAIGTARGRYTWAENTAEKTVREYVAIAAEDVEPEVQAEGTASFDLEIGWLHEASMREALVVSVPAAGIETRVVQGFRCALRESDSISVEADWDGPWQSPAARPDAADGAALYLEHMAEVLEGVRVGDLVGQLATLLGEGKLTSTEVYQLADMLSWLVRLDASAVADIELLLADATMDPNLSGILLSSLGAGGTEAAQSLLQSVAGDAFRPELHRMQALQSMFQLEAPTDALRGALLEMASSAAFGKGLRGTSLLVLGAQARRSGNADHTAALLALEQRAIQDGMVLDWLAAMGNAGHAETARAAARHFQSEEPRLRLAAVDALRHVDVPEATGLLILHGSRDPMPFVRARAAELLGADGSGAALDRVAELLHAEPDAVVREAALRGLRRTAKTRARARELLAAAASGDADPRLRELAGQILSGV